MNKNAHLGSASASRAGEGWSPLPAPEERWMADFLSFFYSHKDPFDDLGPRQIPGKLVFPEMRRPGTKASTASCTCLSLPSRQHAPANREEGAQPVGWSADAGFRGDGVSHSHALDQRSGFMGGACRASMVLCVSPPGLPVIRGYGGSRRKKRRRHRAPPGANTCGSALSYLFLLLFLFFSCPFLLC